MDSRTYKRMGDLRGRRKSKAHQKLNKRQVRQFKKDVDEQLRDRED